MTGDQMKKHFAAGIDIGSVAAKSVIRNTDERSTIAQCVIPTGWNVAEAGSQVLDLACAQAGIARGSLCRTVVTGYGRVSLPFADKSVTEITCHALGAHSLFPGTRTILDIGGQDSKAISIDADGKVIDFAMNDKCAAGTGRFLQVLSGILGVSLDELSVAASAGTPASISSMCAVFAETEIVGLLARGEKPGNVAAGVFLSIARRMRALTARIPLLEECTFTGGLATSTVFGKILAKELGVTVNVPEKPQTTGALGAALAAEQEYLRSQGENT